MPYSQLRSQKSGDHTRVASVHGPELLLVHGLALIRSLIKCRDLGGDLSVRVGFMSSCSASSCHERSPLVVNQHQRICQSQRTCWAQQIESCVHGVLVLALGDIAVVIDASVLNCVLSNLVPIHGLLCVWPRTAPCT